MVTNKKKWLFIWLCCLTLLIYIKQQCITHVTEEYDATLIFCFLLFAWDFMCNYRRFVMTCSHLDGYLQDDKLEYAYYINNATQLIENIYVRVHLEESDWYELDYKLTISPHITINEYEAFTKEYSTVGKLRTLMSKNKLNMASLNSYQAFIHNYKLWKYIGLAIIVILYLTWMALQYSNSVTEISNYENSFYGY